MVAPGRACLAGFLLLGVLLGLLGSLLVAWQYHIDVEPQLIGLHFLTLNAGYVIAAASAPKILRRISIKALASIASGIAFGCLAALVFVAPPAAVYWRLAVLAVMGFGAGCLGTSLLYGSSGAFEQSPATASHRAGLLFGCGCVVSTLVIGGTYFSRSVPIQTALLAIVPLVFLVIFAGARNSIERSRDQDRENLRETLRDLRTTATLLLSLLLFFQFGNEWAVAGWLPLFLIHRFGSNPAFAIGVLAIYFLVLTAGRVMTHKLLSPVNSRKLLVGSFITGMCGLLFLSLTGSLAAAAAAVALIAASFAPIYPLISQHLDDRFAFHPGFYNATISIAITGAMCAPWLLGFVAASLGMRYLMLLPAVGSIIVLLLCLLLIFEARLMADKAAG